MRGARRTSDIPTSIQAKNIKPQIIPESVNPTESCKGHSPMNSVYALSTGTLKFASVDRQLYGVGEETTSRTHPFLFFFTTLPADKHI